MLQQIMLPKVIIQRSKVESFAVIPKYEFMGKLKEIIVDTDKETERVCLRKVISKQRKRKNSVNDDRRAACKLQLSTSMLTP